MEKKWLKIHKRIFDTNFCLNISQNLFEEQRAGNFFYQIISLMMGHHHIPLRLPTLCSSWLENRITSLQIPVNSDQQDVSVFMLMLMTQQRKTTALPRVCVCVCVCKALHLCVRLCVEILSSLALLNITWYLEIHTYWGLQHNLYLKCVFYCHVKPTQSSRCTEKFYPVIVFTKSLIKLTKSGD